MTSTVRIHVSEVSIGRGEGGFATVTYSVISTPEGSGPSVTLAQDQKAPIVLPDEVYKSAVELFGQIGASMEEAAGLSQPTEMQKVMSSGVDTSLDGGDPL